MTRIRKNIKKNVSQDAKDSRTKTRPDAYLKSTLKFVDEQAAADLLGISVSTLGGYRRGESPRVMPPPHLKLGTTIRYRVADLEAWIAENMIQPGTKLTRGRPRKVEKMLA